MSLIEGVVGLIASVFAVLGGMIITARFMARRFDRWVTALVDNSDAMRTLTNRVMRLEWALKIAPIKEEN